MRITNKQNYYTNFKRNKPQSEQKNNTEIKPNQENQNPRVIDIMKDLLYAGMFILTGKVGEIYNNKTVYSDPISYQIDLNKDNEVDKQEVIDLFYKIDTDKDKKLSYSEITENIEIQPKDTDADKEILCKKFIKKVDTNKNEYLDFEEATTLFDTRDFNKDEKLDVVEYNKTLKNEF